MKCPLRLLAKSLNQIITPLCCGACFVEWPIPAVLSRFGSPVVSYVCQMLLEMSPYVLSEGYQNTPSLTADNAVGLNSLAYNSYEKKPNNINELGSMNI